MGNKRKANGVKAPGMGHPWENSTFTKPLPVRGVWITPTFGPVVWADAAGRLDVRDLARAHGEVSEGDVFSQWVVGMSSNMGAQVLLMVRFRKPVRTEFALAFGPGYPEILAEIAIAGRVSMVTREPKVGNGEIECRNAASFRIDRAGLLAVLERMPGFETVAWMLGKVQPNSPRLT